MAYTESDIRPYVKLIVEEEGRINTTQLITKLREILDLCEDDLTMLSGRRDDRFSQVVRNLVRYPTDESGILESYGYIVDKNTSPATFYAKNYNNGNKISEVEINNRKQRTRQYRGRKIDFEKKYEENRIIGDAGERYVVDYERNRLRYLGANFNLQDEVIHASKVFGDGAGYDILSKNNEFGENFYIEVKTTKGNMNTPFFISINELSFLEDYQDCAVIYRVFNFDYERNIGDIVIIDYTTLRTDFDINPVTFKVTPLNI